MFRVLRGFDRVSTDPDRPGTGRRASWGGVVALGPMSDLVVAAVQLTSTEDVAANLERTGVLVRAAARAGAALVGLPENFAYLGSDRDHRLSLAEEIPVHD